MTWLRTNVEWVFSGIGVYVISLVVLIITTLIFRKKVKAGVKNIAKVFVFGSGNTTNINQNDEKK